jgi:hypothetical protein
MAFSPPIGDPPSIELLPLGRLMIDETYQRSIATQTSQSLIGRIAQQWDWRLCVPLLVSRRAEGLYVIDGQHRLEAARRRPDIPYLPCCVSEYGSPADEAATFVAANRKRRAVGRIDTFRAALLAGEPSAVAIVELLKRAGLRLAKSTSANNLQPGEVNAVGALERALSTHGQALLGRVLQDLACAFAGKVLTRFTPLLLAACLVHAQRPNDRARLQAALALRSPDQWWSAASKHADPRSGASAVWAYKKTMIEALDGPAISAPASAPSEPSRPRTFEEQMEAVRNGAKLVPALNLRKPGPDMTLGGVGSAML